MIVKLLPYGQLVAVSLYTAVGKELPARHFSNPSATAAPFGFKCVGIV
jgi:hypothetical protein